MVGSIPIRTEITMATTVKMDPTRMATLLKVRAEREAL